MEIMDNYGTHIMITQAFYFIIHLIILVACIIIANKNKSIGAILLLVSATLTLILYVVQVFMNNGLGTFVDSSININTILMYLNLAIYSLFGLGLLLLALSEFKSYNND